MKLEAVAGIHMVTKTVMKNVNNKDHILIISRDGSETDKIMNSVIRRLNHQIIPYEADLDDKIIFADQYINQYF